MIAIDMCLTVLVGIHIFVYMPACSSLWLLPGSHKKKCGASRLFVRNTSHKIWIHVQTILFTFSVIFFQEDLRQDYNTKYWDQRYTIRLKAGAGKDVTVFNNPLVPWVLRGTADKILTTGKYLNVIRECGRGIACPFAEAIKYRPVEREYALVIEKVGKCVSMVFSYACIQSWQGASKHLVLWSN